MDKISEKMKSCSSSKPKGGAEKERERKKRRLAEEAKSCHSLQSMFLKPVIEEPSVPSTSKITTELDHSEHLTQSQLNVEIEISAHTATSASDDTNSNENITIEDTASQEIMDCDATEYDFFQRPSANELLSFFEKHPQIPSNQLNAPFKVQKAFERENQSRRQWLTYSFTKKALFCSVCLAFDERSLSSFNSTGMCEWRHVYQRISEHEKTSIHEKCCEAYFMFTKNRSVDKLLFNEHIEKHSKKVINNRQIIDRIINILKLIGNRGLSYRGHLNEAAYSLDNEDIDHGNFLEIFMLLAKYDIILKEHLDKIIKQSKRIHESGAKQRIGNFTTFISKTTVNKIISIITNIMKKIITLEIKEARMFSIEIDTTQDITVRDQCSVVIR